MERTGKQDFVGFWRLELRTFNKKKGILAFNIEER